MSNDWIGCPTSVTCECASDLRKERRRLHKVVQKGCPSLPRSGSFDAESLDEGLAECVAAESGREVPEQILQRRWHAQRRWLQCAVPRVQHGCVNQRKRLNDAQACANESVRLVRCLAELQELVDVLHGQVVGEQVEAAMGQLLDGLGESDGERGGAGEKGGHGAGRTSGDDERELRHCAAHITKRRQRQTSRHQGSAAFARCESYSLLAGALLCVQRRGAGEWMCTLTQSKIPPGGNK